MYEEIISNLRKAYDRKVDERDERPLSAWKVAERKAFLELLQNENMSRLLEIGTGTGVHGKFFMEEGLEVICTDLSSEMVKRCTEKGLEAYVMDFYHLDFPDNSFHALFGMNCLLHVPPEDLPSILVNLHRILENGGLFYWGQYGGITQAGTYDDDHYEPKRYFSFLTDNQLKQVAGDCFQILTFKRIEFESEENLHFQAMVLRKP
jgi:ubiquinone/menaquinone biosynthesis C-methylase UbiE